MKRDNFAGSRNCCAIWCSPVSFNETATVRPSRFNSANARSDARKSLRKSEKHRCLFAEGAARITMKRSECACSESMKIDRRMRAFAGSRHAMKLLFGIASSGIENS